MSGKCASTLQWLGLQLLALVLLVLSWPAGAAAQARTPGGVPAAFAQAQARQQDAETVKALSAEGQLLYRHDRVKLDGSGYCAQAVALAERGELRLSIQAASKALLIGQEQDDQGLVASARRDLAIAYSYAGDLANAERYAREALAGPGQAKETIAGPAYKTLADVAARRGRLPEAIEGYRQAAQHSSARFRPLVDISLANAYVAAGRPADARALLARLDPRADGALRQARLRSMGNLALAEGRVRDALALFASAASQAEGSDAAYHRLWAQEGRARSLLALGDKAGARAAYVEAARAAESVRARFRSEEFKSGLFGNVQDIFDRAIVLSMEAGDAAAAWRLSEASRARALLDVVRERVALAGPGAGAPLRDAVPDLGQLAASLREDEVLIEFHSLDDRLLAWTVRRAGIRGYQLAVSRDGLGEQVEALRTAIFARRADSAARARELHALLIAPLAIAPGQRLLVVPHGALHYLPFQALHDGQAYLAERHALAYAPSAGIGLQLAQRRPRADPRLVAFGNPRTEAQYALPAAAREVQSIAALFPEKAVFLEAAASNRQFRQNAGKGSVLHMAAHAQVDLVDPLESRILLAPEERDTGFLNARDVYGLNLDRTALVTLSACESGLGRIENGDEIVGFTRSFLTAGASALLVSLWPVSDESTEVLMTALYRELAAGKDAAQALQTAQMAVRAVPRYAHPFFWAAFDLVGDWRLQFAVARSPIPPAAASMAAR
ncbi:MAG: CHAT domain-containing protein [Telluria sp.]